TFLTLFVLPILYKWTEERSIRLKLRAKPKVALLVLGLCLSVSVTAQQPANLSVDKHENESMAIDQKQAVELALKNFPLHKNKKLEIQQQQALKKTAWYLGTTKIFTGGEEINDGNGVYSLIGLEQQNIDLFGIASKLRLRNEQITLAEKAYELSSLEVAQEVKVAWARAYVGKQQLEVYKRLDSVY